MRKTFTIFCNTPHCFGSFDGLRPAATAAGWTCDSPRGLDFCPKPECQALAPTLKPRGTCSFCGGKFSLRKDKKPTQHTIRDQVTGLIIRCPGSYNKAKP
jgi:hypothetical protein